MGKAQDEAPVLDSPHSEASKLLEAALQQMDGIISGKLKSFLSKCIIGIISFIL